MNRKDLRTAEQEFRATKQPKFEVPAPPRKSIKVLTVLKCLAVGLLLILMWDSLNTCQSTFGADSKMCVD